MSDLPTYFITNTSFGLHTGTAYRVPFPEDVQPLVHYFANHHEKLSATQLLFYKFLFTFYGCTQRGRFVRCKYMEPIFRSLTEGENVNPALVHHAVTRMFKSNYDWQFWRQYFYTAYSQYITKPFLTPSYEEYVNAPMVFMEHYDRDSMDHLEVTYEIMQDHPLVITYIKQIIAGKQPSPINFNLNDCTFGLGGPGFYQKFQMEKYAVNPGVLPIGVDNEYELLTGALDTILSESDPHKLFEQLGMISRCGLNMVSEQRFVMTENSHRLASKLASLSRYMGPRNAKYCRTFSEYKAWLDECKHQGFTIWPWHKGFTGSGQYGIGDTCAQFMKMIGSSHDDD